MCGRFPAGPVDLLRISRAVIWSSVVCIFKQGRHAESLTVSTPASIVFTRAMVRARPVPWMCLPKRNSKQKAAEILHPASKSPAKESRPPHWLHRNEAYRGGALV